MDDRRVELRVATLALAALVSAGALLWLIGAFRSGGDGTLRADFGHSGGVPVGAPVKVAGVAVGRVQAIDLQPDRRDADGKPLPVQMELTVDSKVLHKLHRDARVLIATQGPLGEPYVELDPAGGTGPALQGGEELRGEDPPRLDQLIARMDKLAGTVGELFAGGTGKGSEVGGFLHDAAHLTRDLDGLLTENRAVLVETLKDVHDAAADLKIVASQGRALLADGKVRGIVDDASTVAANLRENVPPTMADARQTVHHVGEVAASFTPEDVAKLRAAIGQYERAGASLDRIATRADKILAEVDDGKGSLGPLLKDDQLYKDLRDLVHDLKAHPWKVLWKN